MISIIYVYYNSYNVITNSIKSILDSSFSHDFEIIIVINKCENGDVEKLQQLSDRIKIIQNEKNLGFGYANNIGVKHAMGKYVLILNPDTILNPDVLEKMYEVMDKNNDVGASICKLVDEYGNIQKTNMRLRYNIVTILVNLFFLHKIPFLNRLYSKYYYNEKDYLKVQNPETISGAFMFIKKSVYEKVNGFDENYFIYSEDNDLSLRMGKITKLLYYPDVTTIHIGATTLGKTQTVEKLRIFYSSMFYLIEKFYGKKVLFIAKAIFKINAIVLFPFIKVIKNGDLQTYLINRNKVFLQMSLRGRNA